MKITDRVEIRKEKKLQLQPMEFEIIELLVSIRSN